MTKEEFIKYCEQNIKDFQTKLIPAFLEDRIFNLLPQFVTEYCINNKEAQERILTLTPTQLDIFNKIIRYSLKSNQDWIPNAALFLNNIRNPKYINFFKSLEGRILTSEEIENLIFLTNNHSNFFDIKIYEDLESVEYHQEKVAEKMKTDDPNIILLTKYGLSYDSANKYLKRYGKDLEHLPDSPEKEFLIDIKNILNSRGTAIRKISNIELINNLNSRLRNLFTTIYNQELYQVNSEKLYLGTSNYNGINIPIYDAGTDFTMSIYSYGLASDYNEPDNYYEDWNRPIDTSINFCNSIITSSSIRTTVKHCIYGFSQIPYNDIQLIAPNDLGTGGVEGNPNVTNFYQEDKLIADVSFRIPEEMVNYTRTTNNEIYRSRKTLVNGHFERVNPNYIVYLKETKDTDMENDPIWRESRKAAVQFGKNGTPLPIVIVDCEECLKTNLQKLDEQITSFTSRYDDISSIRKIVERLYTLISGYRNFSKLSNKYLNSDVIMSYFNKLREHIVRSSEIVPNIALVNINTLIQTLELEHVKQLASPYWIKMYEKETGLKVERPKEIYDILYRDKAAIEKRVEEYGYQENFNLN